MTLDQDESVPLLPVVVDDRWFILSALAVKEIGASSPWTPIPGATDEAPGVAFWRGLPIAIVDLIALTGDLPSLLPGALRRRMLVVETGAGIVGVPVDDAREVVLGKLTADATGPQVANLAARIGVPREVDPTFADIPGLITSLSASLARAGHLGACVGDDARAAGGAGFSTLIVFAHGETRWAVPATQVQTMTQSSESSSESSPDFFELLRMAPPASTSREASVPQKTLVVAADRRFTVRVPGSMGLRQVAQGAIHPLPPLLRTARSGHTIDGLVDGDGQGTVVVVDLVAVIRDDGRAP